MSHHHVQTEGNISTHHDIENSVDNILNMDCNKTRASIEKYQIPQGPVGDFFISHLPSLPPFLSDHFCVTFLKNALSNKHRNAVFCLCTKFHENCIKKPFLYVCFHQRQILFPFIMGILFGISMMAVLFQQHLLSAHALQFSIDEAESLGEKAFSRKDVLAGIVKPLGIRSFQRVRSVSPTLSFDEEARRKNRLFVGVITAEKFLSSRALAVNNTWGKEADKIQFFTQRGSREKYGIPVINLRRTSDSEYPPQRKAFRMLKYICKNHIDDFEWFVRADDDVYIRVKLLQTFLTQFDSNSMIYMGQPGHGVLEVRQKLGLNGHNFCMGGPGVIFSRNALKALCPHLTQCMKEVVSREEDVEIGRCVTNHVHIECTHAWETLKLFYHSYQDEYSEEKPFSGNLAENKHVNNALTLHHIKIPHIMYKVHRHYANLLLNSTTEMCNDLRDQLHRVNARLPIEQQRPAVGEKSIYAPLKPNRLSDVKTWKSFTVKSIYFASPAHVTNDITNDMLADLKQVGETSIDVAIGYRRGHEFTFSHVSDGYFRSDWRRGTDYLFDVYFKSKREDDPDEACRVHLLRPTAELEVAGIRRLQVASHGKNHFIVVVVVSLLEAAEFEAFMRNFFEPTFLAREPSGETSLIVVPVGFKKTRNLLKSVLLSPPPSKIIDWYRIKYNRTSPPSVSLICLDSLDEDVSLQNAFAHGIVHTRRRYIGSNGADLAGPVVLLTSPKISLNPDVRQNCISRSSSSPTAFNNSSFNVIHQALTTRNKEERPQIYQPIPFRIHPDAKIGPFPTALVPQAAGLNPGTGILPRSMVNSHHGFWDVAAATGEDGNAITAPMCGRLIDFYEAARAALSMFSTTSSKMSFRRALYERIFAGKVSLFRTPDRCFVKIPNR